MQSEGAQGANASDIKTIRFDQFPAIIILETEMRSAFCAEQNVINGLERGLMRRLTTSHRNYFVITPVIGVCD